MTGQIPPAGPTPLGRRDFASPSEFHDVARPSQTRQPRLPCRTTADHSFKPRHNGRFLRPSRVARPSEAVNGSISIGNLLLWEEMADRCSFMRAQSTHWDLVVSAEITDPALFVSLFGPICNGNQVFSAHQPGLSGYFTSIPSPYPWINRSFKEGEMSGWLSANRLVVEPRPQGCQGANAGEGLSLRLGWWDDESL